MDQHSDFFTTRPGWGTSSIPSNVVPLPPRPGLHRVMQAFSDYQIFERHAVAAEIAWRDREDNDPNEERALFARLTVLRSGLESARQRYIDLSARELGIR